MSCDSQVEEKEAQIGKYNIIMSTWIGPHFRFAQRIHHLYF